MIGVRDPLGIRPLVLGDLDGAIARFRAALGENAPRIFIKRDDYTGAGFGGTRSNKIPGSTAMLSRNISQKASV